MDMIERLREWAPEISELRQDIHAHPGLSAARYLAGTRDFEGTMVFTFQPVEENKGVK